MHMSTVNLVQGLMTVPIKVCFHHGIVGGVRGAESILLENMVHALIVADDLVAAISYWVSSPCKKSVPILALHDLVFTDDVGLLNRRHWRIVGLAHDILSNRVQAMPNMFHDFPVVAFAAREVLECPTDDFQAVQLVENFEVVNTLAVIPWKRERGLKAVFSSVLMGEGNDYGTGIGVEPNLCISCLIMRPYLFVRNWRVESQAGESTTPSVYWAQLFNGLDL